MRAVLIADDRRDRELAVARHAALIVGFGQEGVHPFEHALGDAAELPHPYRAAEDEDVGGEDLRADGGPGVAIAFVRGNARLHVMRGDADRFGEGHLAFGEGVLEQADHHVGRGFACRF